MRKILLPVLAAALAIPAAAPAATQLTYSADVRSEGGVVVTWHGAPGRCEGAGVCDVRGSVAVEPEARYSVTRSRNSSGTSGQSTPKGGPVRVERGPADAVRGICVEPLGSQFEGRFFALARAPSPYVVDLSAAGSDFTQISAGRCAGPLPEEVAAALPAARVDLRKLGRRTTTHDLSGRTSFTAGPFDGEISSTLRYTVAGHRPRRVKVPGRESADFRRARQRILRRYRRIKVDAIDLTYDVRAVRGQIGVAFAAADAAPGCESLDACGLDGSVTLDPAVTEGANFTFTAQRRARGSKPPSSAGMLSHLRAGRAKLQFGYGFFGPDAKGTLTAAVRRPGGPACTDTLSVPMPSVNVSAAGGLALNSGPLRTHCPGPRAYDVDSDRDLATGAISTGVLGDEQITVTLTGAGDFRETGFGGTRSGAIELDLALRRTSVRRGTDMVRR